MHLHDNAGKQIEKEAKRTVDTVATGAVVAALLMMVRLTLSLLILSTFHEGCSYTWYGDLTR